jgi:peptide/nickel transport system substrate-binding protein
MLAAMVAAGKLPPVEERVPQDVLVWDAPDVLANEDIGEYGGTLHLAHLRFGQEQKGIGFGRQTAGYQGYVPDIAKSWEFSSDYKTLTVHLREGMKWSDGHPFTANDIMFWWDHIIHSEYRSEPLPQEGLNTRTDDIVKVGDYTLRFEFAEPTPGFLGRARGFSGGETGMMFRSAEHHTKQFHPKFSPKEGVDAKEQFNDLLDRLSWPRYLEDTESPTLSPWVVTEYREGSILRMERNPYFFVVDRDGKQLPYIDSVQSLGLVDVDAELIKLKIIAGEVDAEWRVIGLKDVPTLRRQAAQAGIEAILMPYITNGVQPIVINQNPPDPDKRDLLRNVVFRRALSLAIDRDLINDTIFLGLGRPAHGFSEPGVYDPEIDGTWIEYDPDRTNQLLDDVGLRERDAEGYRLLNGKKLTIIHIVTDGWERGALDTGEFVTGFWRDVGIRTLLKPVTHRQRIVLEESGEGYDTRQFSWSGMSNSQFFRGVLGPDRYAKLHWAWWQAKDRAPADRPGVEPTGKMLELFDLYDKITATVDVQERNLLHDQYRRIMADQLFIMGTIHKPHPFVAKSALMNIWGKKNTQTMYTEGDDARFRSWYWQGTP